MPISTRTRARVALPFQLIGAAVLSPLVAAACATATIADTSSFAPASSRTATGTESLDQASRDSFRRFTEADVRFMTGVIAHRAQEWAMTELALSRGDDPRVRRLATRIVSNQEDEIALIRQWLRERGQFIPDSDAPGAMRLADGPDHIGYVAGMVTSQQFEMLEHATGSDFDRLFLTYLIQHHLAAEMLAYTLVVSEGGGQDPIVFRVLSAIQGEQATQVARMNDMLMEFSAGRRD
jgi:uncharacterized protein (DUF305 family)